MAGRIIVEGQINMLSKGPRWAIRFRISSFEDLVVRVSGAHRLPTIRSVLKLTGVEKVWQCLQS